MNAEGTVEHAPVFYQ